jgi:phage/plasmid-like protein (TIGR03299 family)
VQNREAFDFFNHAIEKGAACIETMGALGEGERVFAMAKLPEDFEVSKGDPIERYILLCSSHDGSMNIQAMFSNVRVVCQNTLNAAIRGARQIVRIRHTKNAKSKLEQAHKVLAASDKYWGRLNEAYKVLALKDLSRMDTLLLLEELFPGKAKKTSKEAEEDEDSFAALEEEEGSDSPIVAATRTVNNRNKVLALFDGQAIGSAQAGKTAWGLYNAVTQYIDRDRSVRKDTNRWESSVFGSGTALRQKAFDSLIKVAAK